MEYYRNLREIVHCRTDVPPVLIERQLAIDEISFQIIVAGFQLPPFSSSSRRSAFRKRFRHALLVNNLALLHLSDEVPQVRMNNPNVNVPADRGVWNLRFHLREH